MPENKNQPLINDYRRAFLGMPPIGEPTGDFVAAWPESGNPEALALAHYSPWDNRVLALSCARLETLWLKSGHNPEPAVMALKQITNQLDHTKVDLCTFRTGLETYTCSHLVEERGFKLMDVMAVFTAQAPLSPPTPVLDYKLIQAPHNDAQSMLQAAELASKSFSHSRVYADPGISRKQAENFHNRMVEGLWQDPSHTRVVMRHESGELAGFYLAGTDLDPRIEKPLGILLLINVAPKHQGKGVGQNLLADFSRRMLEFCSLVEIATQVTNRAGLSLYARAGLAPVTYLATFHRWRK